MRKYIREYFSVEDKKGFILLLSWHHVKKRTADRRYYDLYKAYGPMKDIPVKQRRIMFKYMDVFFSSSDRESFILKASKQFPKIKEQSLKRYYGYFTKYLLGRRLNYSGTQGWSQKKNAKRVKPKREKYMPIEKERPPHLKLVSLKDMVDYDYVLTRELLKKYGFRELEVNWLIDEGWQIKEKY